MPWGDWQFWVVTLAAIAGVLAIVRVVRPRKKGVRRISLTIDRHRPKR